MTLERAFYLHHSGGYSNINNRTEFFTNLKKSTPNDFVTSFSIYLSHARLIAMCTRNFKGRFKCMFFPESIYREWSETYQVNPLQITSFAVSKAPNGIDVWLSGGISASDYLCEGFKCAYYTFKVIKTTNLIK